MRKKPEELADSVDSKARFLQFIDALAKDFEENNNEWENKSIKDYLSAISLFSESIENYYINNNIEMPPINHGVWRIMADIFMAGKNYE